MKLPNRSLMFAICNSCLCKRLFLLIQAVTIMFFLNSAHALSPSFDCQKASTGTEVAICESEELSALDRELSGLYKEFLTKLPKEKVPVARRLQSIWIKGREERCSKEPYQFGPPKMRANELSIKPPENFKECLKEYYEFSVSAFKKGVLVSNIFFGTGDGRYPVGINGIDEIIVTDKSENVNSQNGQNQCRLLKEIIIRGGKNKTSLAKSYINDCPDKSAADVTAGIRFYLMDTGTLLSATVKGFSEDVGRYGCADNIRLSFFKLSAGMEIHWYTGENQVFLHNNCDSIYLNDWGVNGSELVFHYTKKHSWYFWIIFPEIYWVAVHPDSNEYLKRTPSNFSEDLLADIKTNKVLERLYTDSSRIEYPDMKWDDKCAKVYKGIRNYITLKSFAAEHDISLPHAFHLAEHAKSKMDITGFEELIRVTAGTFLDYLDKARKMPAWQDTLLKFARGYQEPNHHYFMIGPDWEVSPLKEANFHSEACMANTPAPTGANSLEDWIYLFWARRIMDGTLERSEQLLRTIL